MNRQSYYRYLRSPGWKSKAHAARLYYGFRCAKCGRYGWQVHHLSYKHLGAEPLSDLQVLCDKCHKRVHRFDWIIKIIRKVAKWITLSKP